MKKLITLSLLTLTLFTACGRSEEPETETPEGETPQESIQTPEEAPARRAPEEIEPSPTTPEVHSEQFDTIDEYLNLVVDSQTNATYKTSEPDDVVMVQNVTREGTNSVRYEVWGPADWESNPEEDQIFYIKAYLSDPNTQQETVTWFGPFEGKLNEESLGAAGEES